MGVERPQGTAYRPLNQARWINGVDVVILDVRKDFGQQIELTGQSV